jgi:hypothetical protein
LFILVIVAVCAPMQLENDEAVRFAASWAKDGKENAVRGRKVGRVLANSFEGGHTPNRDRNYMQFNILVSRQRIFAQNKLNRYRYTLFTS